MIPDHDEAAAQLAREWQRTKPVPPGHSPEPEVEVAGHAPKTWMRAHVWYFDKAREGLVFRTSDSGGGWTKKFRMISEHGGLVIPESADLRTPWRVAPLDGKYYGTYVLDADGEEVTSFWDHSIPSHPSEREKAALGDWTETAWADYCCDSHWECERDYVRACAVVNAVNAAQSDPDAERDALRGALDRVQEPLDLIRTCPTEALSVVRLIADEALTTLTRSISAARGGEVRGG